jgi:hypothetical protein
MFTRKHFVHRNTRPRCKTHLRHTFTFYTFTLNVLCAQMQGQQQQDSLSGMPPFGQGGMGGPPGVLQMLHNHNQQKPGVHGGLPFGAGSMWTGMPGGVNPAGAQLVSLPLRSCACNQSSCVYTEFLSALFMLSFHIFMS